MNDRKKIILMYVGIALFAIFLVVTFTWLRTAQEKREEQSIAMRVGKEKVTEMIRLENDLVATNQDGKEVKLSDLRGKVWLAAQFFAACPNCAARNGDHLIKFYKKYQEHEDFHMVCLSVDPEQDDVSRLKKYAQALNAETKNWWFLTGPRESLHRYMEEEMKFLAVRERQDPAEIEREGRYAHDMGVAIFDKGLVMREKKDLFFAKEQGAELYEHFKSLLTSALDEALQLNK